ncbi:MAG: GNAT family N-acetyltransferase [Gammaproteobacteria bacterium]|nr:GNAT family N-acetyltransferase [Gammaproteobacteria bacterium]
MDILEKQRALKLSHRLATRDDQPAIIKLMHAAISQNMKPFLSSAEIEAAQETMGLDTSLLEDQSYFIVETEHKNNIIMVGCGGWGKRKTLYGSDETIGRDDRFSDPTVDPARIRAMYTHPDWIRCGVGTLLLDLGEKAARDAGFKSIELGATLSGEPLYLARGYIESNRETQIAANGSENIIITMLKRL